MLNVNIYYSSRNPESATKDSNSLDFSSVKPRVSSILWPGDSTSDHIPSSICAGIISPTPPVTVNQWKMLLKVVSYNWNMHNGSILQSFLQIMYHHKTSSKKMRFTELTETSWVGKRTNLLLDSDSQLSQVLFEHLRLKEDVQGWRNTSLLFLVTWLSLHELCKALSYSHARTWM